MRPRPPVHTATGLVPSDIAHGVVTLGDGQVRAVLEARGAAVGTLGETDQEALLAGFAAFLNGLAFPVQFLARKVPLDLDPYLRALEERAAAEPSERLRMTARDHAALLGRLALDRTLLERRGYVVVPADAERAGRPGIWPWGRQWSRETSDRAGAQLDARCDEVILGLGRGNLAARRLDDAELARLFDACWRPERGHMRRLGAELDGWSALAVQASATTERTDP